MVGLMEEAIDISSLCIELETYFYKTNRSDIRVKELREILIPFIRLARMKGEDYYGKYLSEIKTFRAPMSKKNWAMIIEDSSLKELENE